VVPAIGVPEPPVPGAPPNVVVPVPPALVPPVVAAEPPVGPLPEPPPFVPELLAQAASEQAAATSNVASTLKGRGFIFYSITVSALREGIGGAHRSSGATREFPSRQSPSARFVARPKRRRRRDVVRG